MVTFGRLDEKACREHLGALLDVHSDVSNWTDRNLLFELSGKWELSVVGHLGKPVCYAILSTKWDDRVHIHQFMVHRDCRNSGIGGQLLVQAKECAFAFRGLLSLKVMKSNKRAMAFYERHGFGPERCEEQQVWYVLRR